MAANVTIASTPQFLEPINTDGLWFSFTTTNYTLANFRYYAETYYVDKANTSLKTSVGRIKVVADRNGVGAFTPHSILKSYLTNTLTYTTNGASTPPLAESSLVAYTVKSGVGYNPRIGYGTSSTSGIARGGVIPISEFTAGRVIKPASLATPTSGTYYYVRMTAPASHGWLVGDEITISKNNKGANPYYDGKSVVVATGSTYVDLNILYTATPYVTGGSIDNTATPTYVESGDIIDVISMRGESQVLYTWNAVRQYEQKGVNWLQKFSLTTWAPGATLTFQSGFLTNYNFRSNWKEIYQGQLESQMFTYWNTGALNTIRIKKYNAAGTLMSTHLQNISSINPNPRLRMYAIPTGTKNWQGVAMTSGGTLNLLDAAYYSVEIGNSNYPTLPAVEVWSEPVKYKIVDGSCVYENIRIAYLNRAGGYDFVNFSQASSKNMSVARKEIQKSLPYNYSIGDRATHILSTEINETFTANTNFLSEHDYGIFTEVLTSPDVYILKTEGSTEFKIPIILTDSSFKFQNRLRDKLFQLTINYKLAHKTITQQL